MCLVLIAWRTDAKYPCEWTWDSTGAQIGAVDFQFELG
jgi:hypothetical protein